MIEKSEKKLSGTALLENIQAACRGLRFTSETDSDITPILSANSCRDTLEEFVSSYLVDPSAKVIQRPSDYFFDPLTRERDWHGPDEKRVVDQYRRLRKLMYENIDGLTYFRAGRVRISIFVIGRDADGNIAGIRTFAVET